MATALKFAGEFGGGRFYIPETVAADHPLAKALGIEAARKVAEVLGHGPIVVPLGPASDGRRRRSEIARMIHAGMSDMEIWRALKPRCHIETIGRVRRSLAVPDPRQRGLFDKRS